ncbi:MAG: hypothetical protein GXO75_15490 [Calditrichaeota bacterium]|nr:hypothetical protein [Calditrichota bacterium]
MSRIIIGIHGLKNKPPEAVLKKWWKASIREGLAAIGHPEQNFQFELVYWAKYLHSKPLNLEEKDRKSPLFVDYPYIKAETFRKGEPNKLRQKLFEYIEKQTDKIFLHANGSLNFSAVSDLIISRFFKDLDIYFTTYCTGGHYKDCLARDMIRKELAKTLEKHRRKQILLIGHSMGSIIAYDVLTLAVPHIKIDTLITAGSPLGLPAITSKILSEQKSEVSDTIPHVPENVVRQWCNFSDLSDKVAMNYTLADDYAPSTKGVHPEDVIVYNNYEINGKRNPHKSYGYLRTPEMAGVIYDFLTRDRNKAMIWFENKAANLWEKIFAFK